LRQMVAAKKDKTRPKREAPKPKDDESDDDDDDDDESEEEEVESVHAKRKREKGRAAFMLLLRRLFAIVAFCLLLSKQPFMVKPREAGVNKLKVVPLDLAICGFMHWAKDSPMMLKNKKLAVAANQTARVLLTPFEYYKSQRSKKTIEMAYNKTERALLRAADGDSKMVSIATTPIMTPNLPLLGAYLLILGAILAPFSAGFEYLTIAGCGCLVQGCRGFGMEPQPELYVAGAAAVLGCILYDNSKPKKQEAKKKRR